MAETPRYAHLVALLFLGSAFVIFICVLVAAAAMISKSARIAKFAAAGATLTGVGYVALLFARGAPEPRHDPASRQLEILLRSGLPHRLFD